MDNTWKVSSLGDSKLELKQFLVEIEMSIIMHKKFLEAVKDWEHWF